MKDFLLRNLEVNDSVVMMMPRYRTLVVGRILHFSKKMVRVRYKNLYGSFDEISRKPADLVKVDGPELTNYLLLKE